MEEEPNFELFLNEVQEPPAKQARFASVSASDVEEMLAKRVPENTKKATLKWVTVFNEYLAEKGIGFDFGTGGAEELSLILSQTYPELRQKNGEPYSKSSLLGFRAAIQRHLRQLHWDINIFDDREFTTANEILDAQLKKQKREGDLKPVKHKEPLTDSDFSKLMQYFRTHEDPVSLTEKVWFYITYHFCLRACESQAMLRVEDFEEKHDEQEQPYFVLSTSFTSKNHQGGMSSVRDTVSEGRIQAPSQVAAMKLLFSKLDDKSDRIFPDGQEKLLKRREVVHRLSDREEHNLGDDETSPYKSSPVEGLHQSLCQSDLHHPSDGSGRRPANDPGYVGPPVGAVALHLQQVVRPSQGQNGSTPRHREPTGPFGGVRLRRH